MQFELSKGIEILERTPGTLRNLLRGLSPSWFDANEGPDTWSPRDVLGHLLHGEETDWIPRVRIILEHGEAKEFVPFDRFAQFERFRGMSQETLLKRFDEARSKNIETLRSLNLSPAQLQLRGVHPAFKVVTLGQLLSTWVVHDLGHLAQITRVMAKQYAEATGPWREYLRILSL